MKGLNDGVKNEKEIVASLDGKQFKQLTECQKKFISQLNPNVNEGTIIRATKVGGQGYKPDVKIEIDNVRWNVSVKKGGGNSIHQEKTKLFLYYCIKFLGMTEDEKNSLLLFLYGDGTINGDSLAEERLNDNELKMTYKKEINKVQKFLDRNKRNLIERFLIYGRDGKQNNIKADYLYHGDYKTGLWCPLNDDAIDFLVSLPNNIETSLAIGPLSLQVWNRNLDAKLRLEDRRHSIQVKWGSCKTYIEQINKICLENKREDSIMKNNRVIGNNSQGFRNQDNLLLLLDGQRVNKLTSNIKELIKEMYPYSANSEFVHAMKITGEGIKPRIAIKINGEVKNLSIFMGSGNSVHQENIQFFLPYCKNELNMTDKEELAFMKILYGDGTIDGKGKPEDRLNDNQIKEKYSDEINIVQSFLDRNKKVLIERFLIYGKNGKENNIKSDYIYYGTGTAGRCIPYPYVVEYIMKQKKSASAVLAIGSLTIQTWNRNLSVKPQYEYKRESIQVKWGSMKRYFNKIRELIDINKHGTIDGDWEEFQLVSKLNRNKNTNSKLWKIILNNLSLTSLEDVHAVKVSNTVYSKLAGRNVLPKADIYLIKGKIPHEIIINNNYWLDEDIIKLYKLEAIKGSGISCKRPDSSNFTYAKLSKNSFIQLFNSSLLGAGISIFVKKSELYLNESVVNAWGLSTEEVLNAWKLELQDKGINEKDIKLTNAEVCKIIKNGSVIETEKRIKDNTDISDAIFMGKGVFPEPYTATLTYINGEIEISNIPEFSITTGSGRHKGIYTIVIKPYDYYKNMKQLDDSIQIEYTNSKRVDTSIKVR